MSFLTILGHAVFKLAKINYSGQYESPRAIFLPTFFFFLLFAIFLSNFGQEAHCAQVTLTWDPNNESDLAGYKIYSGLQSGNYQNSVDVGNATTYILNGLNLGVTYYIAATAYNTQGLQSGFSNEVVYSVPSCTYSISPSSASFPASGGSGSVNVTTQAGCSWGTSSAASWVTINSGSGTGNGTMSYSVSPNTGITSQVASLTIAGNVFTVNEAGLPAYTISIAKNGTGDGSVSINPTGTTFAMGTRVTLSASPDVNSIFSSWSGACTGTSSTCQVTLNSNLSVTATFSAVRNTPIVTTNPATSITLGSATLNGTVNPYGLSTTYRFQWGLTTSYGNTSASQSAGNVRTTVAASTNITGLTANMTYHYRLIATNSGGTTYGTDGTFYTRATGQVDFNNDGKTDLLWRNKTTGDVGVWYLNGATPSGSAIIYQGVPLSWEIAGTGDFNGDGKPDILWHNKTTGDVSVWYMNGTTPSGSAIIYQGVPLSWEIAGTGDFNGDGKPDILWHNKTTGDVSVWYMNGTTPSGSAIIYQGVPLSWEIAGTGDFNGDGKPDILWHNKTTGDVSVWFMNGTTLISGVVFYQGVPLSWEIAGTGDFNGDGKPDILWQNKTTGDVSVWFMNGVSNTGVTVIAQSLILDWELYAR